MEQPVSHATVITLSHFGERRPHGEEAPVIAGEIMRVMQREGDLPWRRAQLPSLSGMREHFACSHLMMYDALRLLRDSGYDYSFSGLDAPIDVWIKPELLTTEEEYR